MIILPKNPQQILLTKELWEILEQVLTPFELELIKLRYIEMMSLRRIAKKLGFKGRPQAKKEIESCLEKCRAVIL